MRLGLGPFVLIPCMADIHRAETDNQRWKILPWDEEGIETLKSINGNGNKEHRCLRTEEAGRQLWLAEGSRPGQHWTFTPITRIQETFLVNDNIGSNGSTTSQVSNATTGAINSHTQPYTSRLEDVVKSFC